MKKQTFQFDVFRIFEKLPLSFPFFGKMSNLTMNKNHVIRNLYEIWVKAKQGPLLVDNLALT